MRRRAFIRRTAVAGTVSVLGSGVASAGGGDDALDAPDDYPGVTTRDHFSINWYGGVELDAGKYEYGFRGDWSKYDDGNELELFVHGWRSDDAADDDINGAYTAEKALQEQGYDPFGAVFTWDADKGGGIDQGWYEAQDIANRNGPKLAKFVHDWLNGDGRPIRLVAHSLGAQVVGSAMNYLASWGYEDAVESLVLLGGAADDQAYAVDGKYGSGVATAPRRVLNCYKTDDSVLEWAYSLGELDTAVGETGVEGTPPANMTEVNVTNVVPDHYSYPELKADGGCMDVVVNNW
jgi:esterase/lipase superfamily enzyme